MRSNKNKVGDICLASSAEKVPPKSIRSVWVLLRNCPLLEGLENLLRKYFGILFTDRFFSVSKTEKNVGPTFGEKQ